MLEFIPSGTYPTVGIALWTALQIEHAHPIWILPLEKCGTKVYGLYQVSPQGDTKPPKCDYSLELVSLRHDPPEIIRNVNIVIGRPLFGEQ